MATILTGGRLVDRQPNKHTTRQTRVQRDRIWDVMRIRKRFTNQELATMSDSSPTVVSKYRKALEQAGYIRVVNTQLVFKRQVNVYGFVYNQETGKSMDTGPIAPLVRYVHGELYDGNTKETIQLEIDADIYFGSSQ